jgi:antitoxin PrlF
MALGLREGDSLAYIIEKGRVVLTRADRAPAENPFATFHEWESEAGQHAYAGL